MSIAAVTTAFALTQSVLTCPGPEAVETAAEQLRTQTGLPGALVAVFDTDTAFYGLAGVLGNGVRTPLTPGTGFYHGSNGKAVTASMIASVVEDGYLSWDSTPAEIFADAADRIHPGFRDIPLSWFLRHLSGMESHTSDEAFAMAANYDGTPREARYRYTLDRLAEPPAGPPGETAYSNAGIVVAAAMAERAANTDFETLIEQRVLHPLGLRGGFGEFRPEDEPFARGHAFEENAYVQRPDEELPVFHPPGHMWMTAASYVRFAQAHIRGLSGEDIDGFLTAESIQTLHTPIEGSSYGAGWGVQEADGQAFHAHLGGAGLSLALVVLRPDTQRGFLFLANGGGGETEPAMIETMRNIDDAWRDCEWPE